MVKLSLSTFHDQSATPAASMASRSFTSLHSAGFEFNLSCHRVHRGASLELYRNSRSKRAGLRQLVSFPSCRPSPIIRNFRYTYRADRIGNLPALRDQHIDLSQLRNDLFCCMPLPRHWVGPFPTTPDEIGPQQLTEIGSNLSQPRTF